MRDVQVEIPPNIRAYLRDHIATTGGNEVFFLARVKWSDSEPAEHRTDLAAAPVPTRLRAVVHDVDVLARGNRGSVPAVIQHAEDWDLAIHNHPGGNLEPSDADISIAAELASRSVGFAIISNDAERCFVSVPPFPPRDQKKLLDLAEIEAIFSSDGPLAEALGDYEPRAGQRQMALDVARSLNEGQVVAVEAATGVGKSFAYLVPAILWALDNRERVVVSTGTIQLQEQLVEKDLPLLRRALPREFKFALIKGRGNYVCRRKHEELVASLEHRDWLSAYFDDERLEELRHLAKWAGTTSDGSRADLNWSPSAEAWEEVMSETDKSLKVECKYYSTCFYYEARRVAAAANVLVVNHHLFFADLSVRRQTNNFGYDAVIPGYSRVVFDEAHHLEDVASEHLGDRVTPRGIMLRLGRMMSPRNSSRGRIGQLAQQVQAAGDPLAANSIFANFEVALPEARMNISNAFAWIEEATVDQILSSSADTASGAGGDVGTADSAVAGRAGGLAGEHTLRWLPPGQDRGGEPRQDRGGGEPAQDRGPGQDRGDGEPARGSAGEYWAHVQQQLEAVGEHLGSLITASEAALDVLQRSRLPTDRVDSLGLELRSFSGRLASVQASIKTFCDASDSTRVRWLSARSQRSQSGLVLNFAAIPIRVAEALHDAVYDTAAAVVLTSATLSVDGKVDFLADRLGLDLIEAPRFQFASYDSPFDFRRQSRLLVPTDIPDPGSPHFAAFVPGAIYDLVRASRGRAFVLFTSYKLLRSTYAALAPRLREAGLLPMAQGEGDRSGLLRKFKASRAAVLFGTDSFWEGVDVKGDALENVVITRLPFRVPSEPLQQARVEELESRGVHPFAHFTVPQAVLKFKQGFGRLIRSTTDRGVVAVLDRRIATKPYGRLFVRSLPDVDVVVASIAEVVKATREFFGGEIESPVSAEPGQSRARAHDEPVSKPEGRADDR